MMDDASFTNDKSGSSTGDQSSYPHGLTLSSEENLLIKEIDSFDQQSNNNDKQIKDFINDIKDSEKDFTEQEKLLDKNIKHRSNVRDMLARYSEKGQDYYAVRSGKSIVLESIRSSTVKDIETIDSISEQLSKDNNCRLKLEDLKHKLSSQKEKALELHIKWTEEHQTRR